MPYFDYDHIVHGIHEEIRNTSLQDMAVAGTGLAPFINSPTAHGNLEGPFVLEITHVIEIGICASDLEEVRQERAHIRHQQRVSRARAASRRGRTTQSAVQVVPDYPRKRLKIFLTDGFIELEAIECGNVPEIALGETPMGTKVRV